MKLHRYGRHCKRHYVTEKIEPMLTFGKHSHFEMLVKTVAFRGTVPPNPSATACSSRREGEKIGIDICLLYYIMGKLQCSVCFIFSPFV